MPIDEADRLPGGGAAVDALIARGLARQESGRVLLEPVVCAGSAAGPGGDLAPLMALARAAGCRLPMAEAARALGPLGLGKPELSAAIDRIEASGLGSAEGGTLVLARNACGVAMPGSPSMDVRRRVQAAEWLEAALAAAAGCRAGRAALAGEGVGAGLGPADFDQAAADLAAQGRAVVEGGVLRLSDCAAP